MTKEVRELTKHNRTKMRDPGIWDMVVAKAVEDFDLMLFLGE
jgi:hypothetical protein